MNEQERMDETGRKALLAASVLLAAVLLVACGYAWLSSSPADTSRTRITIHGTGAFSRAQIRDAEDVALKHLRGFHGCRIDSLDYEDTQSKSILALEQETTRTGGSSSITSAISRYGMANVIMLTSDYTCAHGGASPESAKGWGLWYAWSPESEDASKGWVYIDEGY